MKTLSMLLIAILVLTAVPAFACSGSCGDKDKDDQAFTTSVEYLCGGSCCDKDKPAPDADDLCGGTGDEDKDEQAFTPSASYLCGGSCPTGDKEPDKDA